MNIGRITGFAYGYKEHGSKWMQQNIMFMYGLYSRGKTEYGRRMLDDILSISMNSAVAKTFPGVASFYEPDDRGAYMYLTGSSTWLFLTLVTQIFGVRGAGGNLLINPKIPGSFFDENGEAYIECTFSRKRIGIKYKGNGLYTVSNINLKKEGKWELKINLKKKNLKDSTSFFFPNVLNKRLPAGKYSADQLH